MAAGLDKKVCQQIARLLSKTLANTYLLLVKTQNFHWNVVDARFQSLHKLFEKQYETLFESVDTIAERIRMLGVKAPGSMREFLDLGSLDEASGTLSGDEMISELIIDHELVIKELRLQVDEVGESGDAGTADMLTNRLREHEKTYWMLRSHFYDEV